MMEGPNTDELQKKFIANTHRQNVQKVKQW